MNNYTGGPINGNGRVSNGANSFSGDVGNLLFGGGAAAGVNPSPRSGVFQRAYIPGMLDRPAPMMNTVQSDQTRQQQMQLAQMLGLQANGQAAGPGELAVNRGVANAMGQQTAQAQMARGANAALAGRQAARNNADIGVTGAGQAGIAQMQDKMNATGQLAGLLGNTRAQDIGVAGANQNAQMGQQQIQLGGLAALLGIDEAELAAQVGKAGVAKDDKGIIGGLATGLGSMLAMSDERAKTNVRPADWDVDDAMHNLKPVEYMYKEPEKHGYGPRVGVMAQDLQASHAGNAIVEEQPDGSLAIDVKKALSLALAMCARLDARVRELEGR